MQENALNAEYLSIYMPSAAAHDRCMRARDIMTREVITIAPGATIQEVARLLIQRQVSGVPVVDNGRVVGVVSEADLVRRHEIGTDRKPQRLSWWMRFFRSGQGPAEYVKSHAAHAADVMTRGVACISEDEPIATIASLLSGGSTRRVLVGRDGKLTGIVTRANLVRALAAGGRPAQDAELLRDDAIRARLLRELEAQAWWPAQSSVVVSEGVVHYWGLCESDTDKQAARVAAENIPGVRRVHDHRIRFADLPYSMG
jgi:CBS domain-containing protein